MNKKNIKKIVIQPGCVSCGTCQAICPQVFEIDGICKIKETADFNQHREKIKEAADICPVGVIAIIGINKD